MSDRVIIGLLSQPNRGDRRQAILETWASVLPADWSIYFLLTRPGQPPRREGNLLYLDMVDAYENLPTKTHLFMRYCVENEDFRYLLKADDDTFFNPYRLRKRIESKVPLKYAGVPCGVNIDRTWHFGKCTDPVLNVTPYAGEFHGQFCCGGLGYVVDRQAAEIVGDPRHAEYFRRQLYEDKAVGDLLLAHGIGAMFWPWDEYAERTKDGPWPWPNFHPKRLTAAHPMTAETHHAAWNTLQNSWQARWRGAWNKLARRAA